MIDWVNTWLDHWTLRRHAWRLRRAGRALGLRTDAAIVAFAVALHRRGVYPGFPPLRTRGERPTLGWRAWCAAGLAIAILIWWLL